MPYIASNGELYDDEEIFVVEKNVQDEFEDDFEDYNYMPVDEVVMSWERKMKVWNGFVGGWKVPILVFLDFYYFYLFVLKIYNIN